MASLYILIPVALLLIGAAVIAFLWAVNHDQFEDLDTEARRPLFDEDPQSPPERHDE